MCCFSGPVRYVGRTQIFARLTSPTVQFIAYQMTFQSDAPVAMVLPLPTAFASTGSLVNFISLRDYPDLFKDMQKAFPGAGGFGGGGFGGAGRGRQVLPVENVGDFVASYVPSIVDFARLDTRFRLPRTVWDNLPQYQSYGFAVFQLKAGANRQTVHPIAFEFSTRLRQTLYFPTVHIHDGKVHPQEDFDHTLYMQAEKIRTAQSNLQRSLKNAGEVVNRNKTQDFVDPDQPLYKIDITGRQPNRDILFGIS